jgi:hypothetical protein
MAINGIFHVPAVLRNHEIKECWKTHFMDLRVSMLVARVGRSTSCNVIVPTVPRYHDSHLSRHGEFAAWHLQYTRAFREPEQDDHYGLLSSSWGN